MQNIVEATEEAGEAAAAVEGVFQVCGAMPLRLQKDL